MRYVLGQLLTQTKHWSTNLRLGVCDVFVCLCELLIDLADPFVCTRLLFSQLLEFFFDLFKG